MQKLSLIASALLVLAMPALARGGHHSGGHSHSGPYKAAHEAATGDYARGERLSNDTVLSTGWTGGHGTRQQHISDYYRHTKSGKIIHVHSYYRH